MDFHTFSDAMCFSYGDAVYTRDQKSYKGEAVLTAHKLYLKNQNGEITATFVPLEKIVKVRFFWGKITISVRPSHFMEFQAQLKGKPKRILSLLRDLVKQRKLQKRFFGLEWHDPDFFKDL